MFDLSIEFFFVLISLVLEALGFLEHVGAS